MQIMSWQMSVGLSWIDAWGIHGFVLGLMRSAGGECDEILAGIDIQIRPKIRERQDRPSLEKCNKSEENRNIHSVSLP
jgi:hypothetical protein